MRLIPGTSGGGVEGGGVGGESGAGSSGSGGMLKAEPGPRGQRRPVSSEVVLEAVAGDDDTAPDSAVHAATLERRIAELEADLAQAEAKLAAQSQRLMLERELSAAGVVDLETGVVLAERLLEGGDEDDPARAVARLRARKPFLFPDGGTVKQHAGSSRSSAMSADAGGSASAELDEMALSARSSGDRRELLRYLRARRGL